MNTSHWFWLALIIAVVVWYSSVTIWVAIRGALDIRLMVQRLDEENAAEAEDDKATDHRPSAS